MILETEDPAALAGAWRLALRDAAARHSDGMVARARVEHQFGLTAMVRRYESLYRGEPTGLSP